MTADLEATDLKAEAVQGEVKLERADIITSDIALRQQGSAILKVRDGTLTLPGASWSGPSTDLRLSAKGKVGPEADPLGGATLDAELTGDGDLRLLQALGRGVESGGAGSFRVKLTGPASGLSTEGEIRLTGATLRHRPTRVALDGLTGTLRWGRAGFEIEGFKGSFNGGPLEASGTLRRREPGSGFEGAIRIQARNAFIEWPAGLRAGLRANLVLEPANEGLRLSGALRVQDGTYRTREYFSLQVLDLVNRFATGTSSSPFDPLRLDLTLKSREDIQLDAVDGRIAVGVDLQIRGSVGAPEIGGRLTAAAGGQLFMSGRTYDLESAVLDFTRSAGFEPYVQARAVTRVSEYTVMADVAGLATRVQTRFASTPPLGEQDIVALLTSGRTVGAGGTGSQTDALSMASGGVLGKTGQRLGLDSLKIESTAEGESLDFDPTAINSEADPSSRLTFSKRLAANLSATFSRSLTKTASYTWFVAWKARPSLELRVAQRDDQSVALEFRHDITIGGTKAAAAPARPRRRRRRSGETVTAVTLAGDPVKLGPSDLKLKQGQPFDYETWLDDRDRLEAELGREGYGEGRVLARRESPETDAAAPAPGEARAPRTVALVYDIRRGPRTHLVIEGVPAPADLREKIERAWRLGDFDSSIEEEAVTLTRAQLYEQLYMRAHVSARTETSPEGDSKSLTVRAEAGVPVRTKRIVFEGNAKVTDSRLQALVRETPRANAAWLRPEDLRAAVVTLYESEGLLAAQVVVDEPTFKGDVAELEVRIDEGPVVPIGGVSASGTEHLRPEAALAAARLREGQPFKPAEVEAARARVESAYRRLGYNDATVRSHGTFEAATGTMKVEFQVKEGVREILAEVGFEGGSPDAQAKALRRSGLVVGQPVVLDEWTEARRRLYETGLYRRVDLEPISGSPVTDDQGDRPVKAKLKLEPWPALRLRYGLQALTGGTLASEEGRKELEIGAVTEVSRQTLFGRAAAIGLSVQVRKEDQEARAYLSVPRSFGTPVRSSLFLTMTPEHTEDEVLGGKVDIRKTELTWEERIRATRRLDFAAAYKHQWNRFDFVQPADGEAGPDHLDIRLARVVGTALFDARNNLIDTTRGSFSSASLEWGGERIGSDYPLTRTFVQQFVYLPMPGATVFGAAARVEGAKGQGSAFLDTDRLQAGGANTVRGFDDDALTSRSIVNFLGGSTTLLVLNAELRFPIHGPVRGVVFGDGAISRAKFSDDSSKESIWSTGLGLRYVTPVGILRLDYGIPLDEGFKPKRGRVYFSLGQVF
jgi:outer membrane protein assembly factor BamA